MVVAMYIVTFIHISWYLIPTLSYNWAVYSEQQCLVQRIYFLCAMPGYNCWMFLLVCIASFLGTYITNYILYPFYNFRFTECDPSSITYSLTPVCLYYYPPKHARTSQLGLLAPIALFSLTRYIAFSFITFSPMLRPASLAFLVSRYKQIFCDVFEQKCVWLNSTITVMHVLSFQITTVYETEYEEQKN